MHPFCRVLAVTKVLLCLVMVERLGFRRAALRATTWIGAALAGAVFDGVYWRSHESGPGEQPT